MNNPNNITPKSNDLENRISKLILFGVVYTLLFVFFISTIKYTLPFVLAGIFALILRKPTMFLIEKSKLRPWLASLLSTIIFFSIILFLLILISTSLTNELLLLTKKLQLFISDNSFYYFTDLNIFLEDLLDSLNFFDLSLWNTVLSTISNSFNKFIQVGISGISSLITSLFSIFSYIPYIGMSIVVTLLSTYFLTKSFATSNSKDLTTFIPKGRNKILSALRHAKKMLTNYILTYLFLIFLGISLSYIGFVIFRINYALLLSILAGLLDILPVVGMACIYIPLAIYFFIKGDLFITIGLIILYMLVFLSRQFLEPKLMSSSLGISPFAILISMFIGLQLWGVLGVIFCMFFIIFYTVLKRVKIL